MRLSALNATQTTASTNPHPVNSPSYWEFRFQSDWESRSGPAQTRFFADLAVRGLPSWFTNLVRDKRLTLCDWGCAQGDGTNVLARHFPGLSVTGVDIAQTAIRTASARYVDLSFLEHDLAASHDLQYDVLFSSNTLEHFSDPFAVLEGLCKSVRRFVVLLLPFKEYDRISEHFFTFDEHTIPVSLANGFVLVHHQTFDTAALVPTYWVGTQALLIYAHPDFVKHLTLSDVKMGVEATGLTSTIDLADAAGQSEPRQLSTRFRDLTRLFTNQSQVLTNAQMRIADLEAYIQDKEIYICQLKAENDSLSAELKRLSLLPHMRIASALNDTSKSASDWASRIVRKFAHGGVRGVLSAVRNRARQVRRPSSVVPSESGVQSPESWPYESVQLLKDIEVRTIAERFRFAEGRGAFSVITTVKNESDRLESFLEGIDAQTLHPQELIIVDGGSTDSTVEKLRAFASTRADWVRVVATGVPLNIAAGRNTGVRQANSEVLLFIDGGCQLDQNLFANLFGPFRDSTVDLVGGIYVARGFPEHATHFVPDWSTFSTWTSFLPSARCLAVRRSVFEAAGGFPEYLTLTGEDTLFDIRARRVSRCWVFNSEARVVWDAPTSEALAHKLCFSYGRGDGESGVGDFFFRQSESPPVGTIRERQLSGYREGRRNRARIEVERRHIRGVVLILSGVSFTDIGGGQRATQLALELVRTGYKVVFVNQYPRYGDQLKKVYFDIDLTLIELYYCSEFRVEELAERYGDLDVPMVVLTEFPHPDFVQIVATLKRLVPRTQYLFDYIDLWDSALGGQWYSPKVEDELIAAADHLIASAATLRDSLSERAKRDVHLVANAVNLALFQGSRSFERPGDIPSARPYVVYVGSLYGEWFDWEAMHLAASILPRLDFVFIGDHAGVTRALLLKSACPNVHFLGPKPQTHLPAYLQHAAVCVIPFRTDSAITKFVNPLKVYEYLAMRRPVVATNMDELRGIPGLFIARDEHEFASCIEEAMTTKLDVERIDTYVRENSWNARVRTLDGILRLGVQEEA